MIKAKFRLIGCAVLLFVSNCAAEMPLELRTAVMVWKNACVGKEFDTLGIAIGDVDDLKKDPFIGVDEITLHRMRTKVRFFGDRFATTTNYYRPGQSIDEVAGGYDVWLDGRITGYHPELNGGKELVVVDAPDPTGKMAGAMSGLLLAGCCQVRNRTMIDLLGFYDNWSVIASNGNGKSKLFRGTSTNGIIDVRIENLATLERVITDVLGHVQFKPSSDSDLMKVEYHAIYKFENDNSNELIPSEAELRTLTKSKGVTRGFSSRQKLVSVPRPSKPLERLSDGFPLIPNGTRVQVNDQTGIEFEWRDGEIVRKIDREKVASLLGFKFAGAKWFIPITLLLLAGIMTVAWWRFRKSSS